MWEKDINATPFLLRKLVILPDAKQELHNLHVACVYCNSTTKIVEYEGGHCLDCKHLEQCTECREYQIEKLFRCVECCDKLLGHRPDFCSETCLRREFTRKSTALCGICGSHLQKECKKCKKCSTFRKVKVLLKKRVFVFVRSPLTVASKDSRPCSHYALCKLCNQNIARGHKGNSACKSCRNQSQSPNSQSDTPTSISSGSSPSSDDLSPYQSLGKRFFEQASPPLPVIKKQRIDEQSYDIPAGKILGHIYTPPFGGPLVAAYQQALTKGCLSTLFNNYGVGVERLPPMSSFRR